MHFPAWTALALLTSLAGCAGLQSPESAPVDDAAFAPSPDWTALGQRRLHVGFVMIDGVYGSELVAPFDIFQHTIFHVPSGMKVFTVSPNLDPVTTFEGLRILPDYTFESAPRIDVLVVPSAEHNMDTDLEDEQLMGFVKRVGAEASCVMSLCDGAFVLAQAGLLDGLRSTTFPADIPGLRERFPHLTVLQDVSFVQDGAAITSAGGAKSYDPALYLCELLYGHEKARGIARGLVIDWDLEEIPHIAPR